MSLFAVNNNNNNNSRYKIIYLNFALIKLLNNSNFALVKQLRFCLFLRLAYSIPIIINTLLVEYQYSFHNI